MDFTEDQIKEWKRKAEKWDALDKEIGKSYPDYDDEGNEVPAEEPEADLISIGEKTAIAFGYL